MELQRTSSVELARNLSARERQARARALASIAQSEQEAAALDAQQAVVDEALQGLQLATATTAATPETELQPGPEPEPENRRGGGAGRKSRYLNVAVVGDWSAGKSTATAGLLLASGAVDIRRVRYLEQFWAQHPWGAAAHGEGQGTQPMPLGAIVDTTRKERDRGTTIDGNIVGLHLPDGRVCALFDTPGCPEFAKKSVQMLSQADAAVLVVDATLFAGALHKLDPHGPCQPASALGLQRWQSRVASLAVAFHTFSVKQLVLCVTKMDLVGCRQEVYDEACKQTEALLYSVSKKLSVNALPLVVVAPLERSINIHDHTSALASSEGQMSWWQGPSLLSAIAKLRPKPKLRQADGRAVVIFSKAYKIAGVGTVFVGMVLRGTLRCGEDVTLFPGLVQTRVRTIECFREPVTEATAGMMVGINIANVSVSAFGRGYRGFLLGSPAQNNQNILPALHAGDSRTSYINPARVGTTSAGSTLLKVTRSFVAKVLMTRDSLGKHQRPIKRGAVMTLLGRAGYGHCRVASVLARLTTDGSSVIRQIPFVAQGQLAVKRGRMYELHLTSTQPLFLSESDQIPLINRFLLMDSTGTIVGAGEAVRQKEMRIPLQILSKSPRVDWTVLETHFIVETKTVTVLTMEALEAATPHLLWLDDTCSFSEDEHSVVRAALSGGATVVACLGSLAAAQSATRTPSIGSAVRSSLCPLLDDCGFALVEICSSATALPVEGRLPRHVVAKQVTAKRVAQTAQRRRRPLPARQGLRRSELEEVAFPDDFPDEVLQQIACELSNNAQSLCRLACTCKVFRTIADHDLCWERLCRVDRVEYGALLKCKRHRKLCNRLQHHDDDSYSARPDSVGTGNTSAKQLYIDWYGTRAGPGGAILRGDFGVVRCVHPPRRQLRQYHCRGNPLWPGCALIPRNGVAARRRMQQPRYAAAGKVHLLCRADPSATQMSMGKRMRYHPDRNTVKASVLSSMIRRKEQHQQNSADGNLGEKGWLDDAAVLVHIDMSLAAKVSQSPRLSRGQVVLCVGGDGVFNVDPGRHGSNSTLLLNLAAAAARAAYAQH